ncbi:insecticidal toxin SepC/TccC, partial [Escherichia sp. E1130]
TGKVTSREEYLPYGGSAGSVEEGTEVTNRTRRYSGKERDATGLLYYGWRYYQPETGRWLSADPGGLIDGVNLFRFCGNNPGSYFDDGGLMKRNALPHAETSADGSPPPPPPRSSASLQASSSGSLQLATSILS